MEVLDKRDLLEGSDFEISMKEVWEKVFCLLVFFVFFVFTGLALNSEICLALPLECVD